MNVPNFNHRIIVFLVVAVLLITGVVLAQQQPQSNTATPSAQTTPPARMHGRMHVSPEQRLQRMSQHLNLTEEQKNSIGPILQNEDQQASAIRQDTSLTPAQRRQKMQELRDSTRGQINNLLTPEQRTIFGSGQNAASRRSISANRGALARMSSELNLTDEQKTKLESVFSDQQKQVQAVRLDTSLTQEQKNAKIRELRQATHGQVMSILTPEQQQKWNQQRRGRGMRRGTGNPPQPGPGF